MAFTAIRKLKLDLSRLHISTPTQASTSAPNPTVDDSDFKPGATSVVNIKHESATEPDPDRYQYIGRAGQGQDGYFGNPVVAHVVCPVCWETHTDAASTIPCFEKQFLLRLGQDAEYRRRVLALRGKTLGCFCRPYEGFRGKLLCHGQVMAKWIDAQPVDVLAASKSDVEIVEETVKMFNDRCDIRSDKPFPLGELSNFTPHPFTLDDIQCASMEGFLQALKTPDRVLQVNICRLTGIDAKNAGSDLDWKTTGQLHWRGVVYDRWSDAYQQLLDRAYLEMAIANPRFVSALRSVAGRELTHMVGRTQQKQTILTRQEFLNRMFWLSDYLFGKEIDPVVADAFAVPVVSDADCQKANPFGSNKTKV